MITRGDRFGTVTDPFGHEWLLATHVAGVYDEEIAESGEPRWPRWAEPRRRAAGIPSAALPAPQGCATVIRFHVSEAPRAQVVTVLFADLVGFTSRAEQLDPEDVEAILRPYHERLRYELERWGGTVEKFIGDAVMALFGAPVTREDDPERAVRAALSIRDWIAEEGELQARIAVNTGEALVNLMRGRTPARAWRQATSLTLQRGSSPRRP